ncbi:MAG: sugar ABC transporter substrate-binding protein [Propionibacteriaceae bacterium]|jgi:multiple sugar transport system substrate-binding protein|nr:sugar ABC transporter substrate-binding protein [Propionibacteriaceae bacterium]
MRHIRSTAFAALAAAALTLTACSSADSGSSGASTGSGDASSAAGGSSVTINYWLWDANQLPQYQSCADAFTAENPSIKIEITQSGWNDYWNNLTTGMVAGTAPDVFTDHLNYFADLLDKGQIVDLQPYVDRDGVDMGQYYQGLATLWSDQNGDAYGLPKDWDTIAVAYNTQMLADAGYTPEDLESWTWNPDDGGTYEQIIAHLTVDQNGVRGDEPGFDKTKVAVYGIALDGNGAGFSQAEFSQYFFTTGWYFTDKNPWGTQYNFSDERYKATIAWARHMIEAGYMNDLETATSMDGNPLESFGAGKFATVPIGSWMIGSYEALDGVTVAYAPNPIGPSGKRASMFNGLTDAITTSSKHPEEAWQWVKFLGSAECQEIVAEAGVVFPAISSVSDETKAARVAAGQELDAFFVQVDEGTTFSPPITEHYADILALHQPIMDAILSGQSSVDALDAFNDQVNAMFK